MHRFGDPVVTTPHGAVGGTREHYGERYLAIPYAATPTGAARFAPPRPHAGWDGVRDAGHHGGTAPQPVRDFGSLDMRPYFGPGWIRGDEYLTLDIYTPASDDGGRPVMVYIHGGGFVTGSSQAMLYDGRTFARDGVVLITLNYRLGIPGFLELEGAPPNRGLLDILAALDWIQHAVGAFGGDPANVTIFGQSAGATLVGALLASPAAKGLFQRAIMQSGSGTGAFTPEQARRVTHSVAAGLGAAPTVDALSRFSDEQFVEVLPGLSGVDLRTTEAVDPLAGLSPFSLVLPEQPADTLADGPAADVDLLIGTNTEEGNLYLVPQGNFDTTQHADVLAAAAHAHADPRAAVDALTARRPRATLGELRSELLGAAIFSAGTARMAQAHSRIRDRGTYVYEFGFRSPALGGKLGAAHTIELPFVFDIADAPALHGDTGMLGPEPAPGQLARLMHRSWITFSGNGSPGWTAYDNSAGTVQRFG